MNELTYDPVLDRQPLPKWRLGSPLKPPEPGRALVLVRESGGPLTIRSGEEVPSARFGAYQSVFTVDLTEHRLLLDIEPLLSRDPTFSFRSRVDLVCRVADPAEVVRRGIRDMSGALYGHLRRMLREVSREYDIAEFHEAETALNATLRDFTGDSAIRLRNIGVELLVDEEEIAASGRSFRDVVRETRLDGMRRDRHLRVLREEGEAGLVAEIMEREGPRAALAWVEQRKADERNARLAAAELVLKRGDADREPFEQAELERAVVEDVLGDGGGLFGDGGDGSRRGRLRGALASGGRDRDRDREPDRDRGPEETGERSPLRGEVVPPRDTAPPDDEPLPPPGGGRPWGTGAMDRDGGPRAGSGTDDRRTGSGRPGARDRGRGDGPDPGGAGREDDRGAGSGGSGDRRGGSGGHGGGAPGRAGGGDGGARRESRVRGTAGKRRPDDDNRGERR
ncbi:hypothetical protein [Streptomyces sp. NPDC001985]|uniref:hypothetical protein n=1 Tax=Streptomyces sp. NPDC001985 TaxID=3154406 RepID=UPI00331EC6AD